MVLEWDLSKWCLDLHQLNFELRKKFERVNLINLFELSKKASRYESLLKEENQRRNPSMRTYYQDPNFKIDVVEYVGQKPYVF